MSDITLSYFNMEHPIFGGYSAEKVALRGVMAEYAPARSKALLDTYGYLDRDGDGWRKTPDGQPIVLEIAATNTQRDRSANELWKKYMSALGLRTAYRIGQRPELVKQSMAGKLMMWGYAWQMGSPDSSIVFGMAYGPNAQSINDARFDLPSFNRLFEQQRVPPGGSERLALLREAARLMVAYMPYLLHMHRVNVDLAQPWVIGYRRHPFTTRSWVWIDFDDEVRLS